VAFVGLPPLIGTLKPSSWRDVSLADVASPKAA